MPESRISGKQLLRLSRKGAYGLCLATDGPRCLLYVACVRPVMSSPLVGAPKGYGGPGLWHRQGASFRGNGADDGDQGHRVAKVQPAPPPTVGVAHPVFAPPVRRLPVQPTLLVGWLQNRRCLPSPTAGSAHACVLQPNHPLNPLAPVPWNCSPLYRQRCPHLSLRLSITLCIQGL